MTKRYIAIWGDGHEQYWELLTESEYIEFKNPENASVGIEVYVLGEKME